jgi:probable HAF family extracellular repeat protein
MRKKHPKAIMQTIRAMGVLMAFLVAVGGASQVRADGRPGEHGNGRTQPNCDKLLGDLATPCRTKRVRFKQFAAPDVDNTVPFKGNRRGEIVGRVEIAPNQRAIIYDGKRFTIFDVPGATQTQGYGINDLGQVVGLYYDADNHYHGYLRQRDGTITTLNAPGAVGTHATEINNSGQIVGYFEEASGKLTGFLLNGGVYIPLSIPGAIWTIPYAINDAGQIAGWYLANDTFRSFVYQIANGRFRLLDVGAAGTSVWGINNAGQMAGFINDDDGAHHGLFIDQGLVTIFDFDRVPSAETVVFGINDAGQLIGFYDGKGFITEALSGEHGRDGDKVAWR